MVRKVLAICLILTLFSMLTAAAGYSSAMVTCNATLKVVASEDALLAVEEIDMDLASKEGLGFDINNGDLDTEQNRCLAIKGYTVKNNSSNTMNVKLKCTKSFDGANVSIYAVKNKPVKWKEWKKLKPGKSIRVLVVVKGSPELSSEVSLELKGKWHRGNAKIWWSFDARECQIPLEGNGSLEDVEKTDGETTDDKTKDEEISKEEITEGGIKNLKDTKGQQDTGEKQNKDAKEQEKEPNKANKEQRESGQGQQKSNPDQQGDKDAGEAKGNDEQVKQDGEQGGDSKQEIEKDKEGA